VFIDTNVFYSIQFKTYLAQIARKFLEEFKDEEFYMSLTTVNKLLHIATPSGYA